MSDSWPQEFARRIQSFSEPFTGSGIPVSVKIRVVSGCFHREDAPHAYRLLDAALREPGLELERDAVRWHEHESGPELLVWIPFVTAGVAFSGAVINLIVSILKARSDGIKAGDRPREPLELVVRTSRPGEGVVEEKVLRFNPDDPVHAAAVSTALNEAARKMLPSAPTRKKKRTRRKSK
jgi:hypothetical protein